MATELIPALVAPTLTPRIPRSSRSWLSSIARLIVVTLVRGESLAVNLLERGDRLVVKVGEFRLALLSRQLTAILSGKLDEQVDLVVGEIRDTAARLDELLEPPDEADLQGNVVGNRLLDYVVEILDLGRRIEIAIMMGRIFRHGDDAAIILAIA